MTAIPIYETHVIASSYQGSRIASLVANKFVDDQKKDSQGNAMIGWLASHWISNEKNKWEESLVIISSN